MCQKTLRIWICGCTQLKDPDTCREATRRNKICEGYPYKWIFRDPLPEKVPMRCTTCTRKDEAEARKKENQAFIAKSEAYPTLKQVEHRDDTIREKRGRPRFDSTSSSPGEVVVVPAGWTPDMNRSPSNANEYSAFLDGHFDPRIRLADTHVPAKGAVERLLRPPEPSPVDQGHRIRPPGAPTGWQSPVSQAEERGHRHRHAAPPLGWRGPAVIEGAAIYRHRLAAPPLGWQEGVPFEEDKSHRHRPLVPPLDWQRRVLLAECEYRPIDRTPQTDRPGAGHRPSYTVNKDDRGWVPPSYGTLPPEHQTDAEPPSCVASPTGIR